VEDAQPTHWLRLPAGTRHVVFRTLPRRLAKTLWPDHAGDEEAQFDTGFTQAGSSSTFRQELTDAVRAGRLRVLNPLTLGTHTFPVGSDIDDALVTVSDLCLYLAERGIGVGFAAVADDAVSSANRRDSSVEQVPAGDEAQQAEAQAQDDIERGMLSVLVIAGMLSDVRELAGDARKPMVEKVIAGARVGAFPVFHRRLRASIDPPMEIDIEHLARVEDVLRWFNDSNEWPVRALLLKGGDGEAVHEYIASTVAQRVPSVAATAGGNASTTAEAGPVVKPSPVRRKTWKDVAWPYMVDKLRAGRFATAVALNHALHEEAGSPGSPFDKGEGQHRGSLWVRAISAPLAVKTIQNSWAELQRAASS
jgi:hypothetical protein